MTTPRIARASASDPLPVNTMPSGGAPDEGADLGPGGVQGRVGSTAVLVGTGEMSNSVVK